ncbi:hypothetical protein JOC34_002165 [Virgibacillus halotolerans]|nr:hypothetical protein [Virgibacillus halotolerans]
MIDSYGVYDQLLQAMGNGIVSHNISSFFILFGDVKVFHDLGKKMSKM